MGLLSSNGDTGDSVDELDVSSVTVIFGVGG